MNNNLFSKKIEDLNNILYSLNTIRDYLRWSSSKFLENKLFYGFGTDSFWDEAVHLVLQSLFLPLDIDDRILDCNLTSQEKHKIIQWVYKRIVNHTPVPYLTNNAWFAGKKFYVDNRVIIPRSPIGELIRNNFLPWIDNPEKIFNVLDLCTGSGCIAISSANIFENANFIAADISNDALNVANYNISQHNLKHKIKIINSDLFINLQDKKFDLIISNPPYVDHKTLKTMPEEIKQEPEIALNGGKDGLFFIKNILAKANMFLNKNGILIIEVGNSQYSLRDQFSNVPFTWLNFSEGGDGVLLMTYKELIKYKKYFSEGL